MIIYSHSPDETRGFAARVAGRLKPGDILCLFGTLGSGKTTFVQGLARGLKINPNKVSSPTFVIMQIYEGRLPVYHFDFYRLEETAQIGGIGYDEFLFGKGVAVVEWPERMGELLPKEYLGVHLTALSDTGRRLQVKPHGKRYKDLIKAFER